MNKLDVAIKLLQLLNERKSLNSRIVADELQVSLRTAQRYLVELSAMPCVVNLNNNHTYALDPTYKINEALLRRKGPDDGEVRTNGITAGNENRIRSIVSNEIRKNGHRLPGICFGNGMFLDNHSIDRLVSIVRKKLGGKRC